MAVILKRKRHKVNEDDAAAQNTQQNTQQNGQQATAQNVQQNTQSLQASVDAINKQIIAKKQEISQRELEIGQLKSKAMQINSQLGKNAVRIEDSAGVKFRYSKRLYEAVTTESKVDMLNNLLHTAITRVDRNGEGVSIVPDKKELRTYARLISRFLANSKWDSYPEKVNHWDELAEEVKKVLSGRKFKYQDGEVNAIVGKFKELMAQSPMFAWIFGEEEK